MNYLDKLSEKPDMLSPGISCCAGCSLEIILRRVLQLSGKNTIFSVPPGCAAGSGAMGWNFTNGVKVPMHISLLDNLGAMMTGVSEIYQRKGREDVNIVAFAGDGASADCGFQSLSGAAERGEHMLYICYDNEGYMNTGFQRSSTTTLGSLTSTTPAGKIQNGKTQPNKNLAFIMAMHNVEYVATLSPAYMQDFVEKVEKGLAASKKGFAYLHICSPCPTGWNFPPELSIEVARVAVKSGVFPLFEVENGIWKQTVKNPRPIPVRDYISMMKKYKGISEETLDHFQALVDANTDFLARMTQ